MGDWKIMLEFIQNLLKESFKDCVGLPADKVLRIYVDARGEFHIIDEVKGSEPEKEFHGFPAKVIASFAAIPKEKYMKYWQNQMHGTGEFTEDDYNEVFKQLFSYYLKDADEHARRATKNYYDFFNSPRDKPFGDIQSIYVISLQTKEKSWLEFYPDKERALNRVNYYLAGDLHILYHMAKEFHVPMTLADKDVATTSRFVVKHGKNNSCFVLIQRNGKLAVSYTDENRDEYILKVRPYEIDSKERYHVFDVLHGAE